MKKILLIALLACTSAHAEFKDGNKLYSQMQTEYASTDWFNAIGYVTGVADALGNITYCAPPAVTAGQLVDMVKAYLAANPQFRHMPADVLVSRTLGNVWPCKKGSGV